MSHGKMISYLDDIKPDDLQRFGGKAVNTAVLLQGGFNVPSGFSISADGFSQFIERDPICDCVGRIDRTDDLEDMLEAAMELELHVRDYKLPQDLKKEILDAVSLLGKRHRHSEFGYAVRSSATVEDGSSFSFAGQAETHLCVRPGEDIIDSVKSVWYSALTPRAVLYLKTKDINLSQVRMSVMVQEMVPADISGVLFTANVVTGDLNQVLIEAIHGLGEPLVGGSATPDTFILNKDSMKLVEDRRGRTDSMLVAGEGGAAQVPLPEHLRGKPVLDETGLQLLLDTGSQIEKLMGLPQDIEWCIKDDSLVILQSRPITTL